MKLLMPLGLIAALAACNPAGDLENEIRADLSTRNMEVVEVKMEATGVGKFAGHAVARNPEGAEIRYNCVAPSADNEWACSQDPASHVDSLKADIRRLYERDGFTVSQVELTSEGENRARGFIVARRGNGPEMRLPCVVAPDPANSTQVDIRCGEGGQPAPDVRR